LPTAVFVLSLAPLTSLQRDNFLWPLAAPPATMKYVLARSMGLTRPHWPAAVRATILRDLVGVGLLAIAVMLLARERSRAAWLRVGSLLLGLAIWSLVEGFPLSHPLPSLSLSTLIAFAVAILAFFLVDVPGRAFLVAFAVFAGLASVRAAVSSNLGSHYAGPAHFATALTSLLFVAVFVPRLLLGEGRSGLYFRRAVVVLVLSFSCWQTAKAVPKLRIPSHLAVETREGTVFTDPEKAEMLQALARNSTPGERVLAFPENHAVDVLFHLQSLSPLTNAIPGFLTVDIERQVIRRSQEAPPAVVVIFRRTFRDLGFESFGEAYGMELAAWFSRNYRVVESLHAGQILRRREEPSLPGRSALERLPVAGLQFEQPSLH